MSMCESIFDCNNKQLEQMMEVNMAVQELQLQQNRTNELVQQMVRDNNDRNVLLQQLISRSKPQEHGFVYYLMTEIAVIYILYLLRNYLTLRNIYRMVCRVRSLYQRILSGTTRFCDRSRSSWTNNNSTVELGENIAVNNELASEYGTRGSLTDCRLTTTFQGQSVSNPEVSHSVTTTRDCVLSIESEFINFDSTTAAKRLDKTNDFERPAIPSETANDAISRIIVV